MIAEWHKKAESLFAEQHVVERVEHLRRMLLVNSCIYYDLADSMMSDHMWQALADELTGLQLLYGHEFGFYDEAFAGWDGATGCHLPLRDPNVLHKVQQLLNWRNLAEKKAAQAAFEAVDLFA